jgi:actin-related protein 2
LSDDRELAANTAYYEDEYVLPDGNVVKIGRERFEATEVLFNPGVAGLNVSGVAELIFECVTKADLTLRALLLKNILLSGGSTMFPGFPTRMQNEIEDKYRQYAKKDKEEKITVDINVNAQARRKFNVFFGGGLFAKSLDQKGDLWITKKDYGEMGAEQALLKKSCKSLQA